MPRKTPYEFPEWHSFACHCRFTQVYLMRLGATLNRMKMLRSDDTDTLIKVQAKLHDAALGVGDLMASQIGRKESAKLLRFMIPAPGLYPTNRGPEVALSRDEWIELAGQAKWSMGTITGMILFLQETVGVTSPYIKRFERAEQAFGRLKSKLDSLVFRQHPEWADATRVFYGPVEASA